MKFIRIIGISVVIVLLITVGLCFGQWTATENLVQGVEHAVKGKFKDGKEVFERFLVEVAIGTTSACQGIRLFQDCISQEDSTDPLADLDDSEDNFEKKLNELSKQFKDFSKELKRIPESEEFKRGMKELERLQEELKRGGESAKEKIEKEIIPRLKEEMEKLKERFLKPREREVAEPIEI